MCGYAQKHTCDDALRGRRVWDPLELELQVLVSCQTWVLGIKLRSSIIALRALNCSAITPAPAFMFCSFFFTMSPVTQINFKFSIQLRMTLNF